MRIKDPTTDMELVYVKGGCYQMGDTLDEGGPEEKPVHEVCIKDFYMGKYEVTQEQWQKVMGENPSKFKACGKECPVDSVSWDMAQAFIKKLNELSKKKARPAAETTKKERLATEATWEYRLPTEAEWEYAARSEGKSEKFSGGSDEVDKFAWYLENSNETHPVGQKAPNGLGIHDMSGNVWEWTSDWYQSTYYASSPRNDPAGPAAGVDRVARGGSWGIGWVDVRTSYRNYLPPGYRSDRTGLRILRTLPPQGK
jgi:formylglycine-generating enzyme required for sulfatase activity